MSPKYAWIILQILSLITSYVTASNATTAFLLETPADFQVKSATSWYHPTGGTAPTTYDRIKPVLQPTAFSGSGSAGATMSPKYAWIILQILPLITSYVTESNGTTAFSLETPADFQVKSATSWYHPTGGTSPKAWDHIKPVLQQTAFSGSGSAGATMSPKYAWIILQILPLITSYVTASNGTPAFFLQTPVDFQVKSANSWYHSTGGTSPTAWDRIKPVLQQTAFRGSGSAGAPMSPKYAWIILQILPLITSYVRASNGTTAFLLTFK